jgi:hypothetical protein
MYLKAKKTKFTALDFIKYKHLHQMQVGKLNFMYFEDVKTMADFLGIKGKSKEAIFNRCKKFNFGIKFKNYTGKFNLKYNG